MTIMQKLEQMLNELESSQLQTVLVPSKRGLNEADHIRVNISINPLWYRQMCAANISKRETRRGKPDTIIRRHKTISILKRMIEGHSHNTMYGERILKAAQDYKL